MLEIFSNPVFFHLVIFLVSLILLMKSADLMVYSIAEYARKLGISDYLIGFIVLSIGTALPELVASFSGALKNVGDIVFGTIIGSNLFKIVLLGILLIMTKKVVIKKEIMGMAPIITLTLTILPIFLVIDNKLSRFDGLILIIAFVIYITKLWYSEGELGKMRAVSFKEIYKTWIIFLATLSVLLISGNWLVSSSIELSKLLNVSPFIIAMFLIGIGGSMPELTIQIKAILKKHSNLAFGNVIGSLVANSAFVLGIVAIFKPVYIEISTIVLSSIFLFAGTLFTMIIFNRRVLFFRYGVFLVILYLAYAIAEYFF